jgi:hypothetical protein
MGPGMSTRPHRRDLPPKSEGRTHRILPEKTGAGNETRTRDSYLGKVVLYQLSYARSEG